MSNANESVPPRPFDASGSSLTGSAAVDPQAPRVIGRDDHDWPLFDPAPAAVLLDVDGTLLPNTTTFLFARMLRRRGFIKRSILLRALYHGLQHHFGQLDYAKLVEFACSNLTAIPDGQLRAMAEENFELQVKPRLFLGVVDHVRWLRDQGAAVAMVSSSPEVVLRPLADHLGCNDLLTTPVRVENGRFLGLGDGPPCYGAGKLHWAQVWAKSRGIRLDHAAAYADNWSDRPLLEAVGVAAVVHPRCRLRQLARERGWLILRPRVAASRSRAH